MIIYNSNSWHGPCTTIFDVHGYDVFDIQVLFLFYHLAEDLVLQMSRLDSIIADPPEPASGIIVAITDCIVPVSEVSTHATSTICARVASFVFHNPEMSVIIALVFWT